MTVKELILVLSKYPENMKIVISVHSDYEIVSGEEIVLGINCDAWVMREHDSMNKEKRQKLESFLRLY